MQRNRLVWVPPASVLGTAVLYSAVATRFEPYTSAMRIATALPCIVVAAFAHRLGSRTPPAGPQPAGGVRTGALAVWSVLIVAAVAFQLGMFMSQPRSVYPTFSSLASIAFGWPVVRAAAFAVWLWIGWYLLKR